MLVSLAREGDRAAFQQLIVERQSALRSMLRRMSGSHSLADDLAQQTFLQAFTKYLVLKTKRHLQVG